MQYVEMQNLHMDLNGRQLKSSPFPRRFSLSLKGIFDRMVIFTGFWNVHSIDDS